MREFSSALAETRDATTTTTISIVMRYCDDAALSRQKLDADIADIQEQIDKLNVTLADKTAERNTVATELNRARAFLAKAIDRAYGASLSAFENEDEILPERTAAETGTGG